MTRRALTFGAVAAAYERFRPGYPDELVDEVLAYAQGQVDRALEIGAGTGKATRAFAKAGVAVTATEPDEAMLAQMRQRVPANVTTVHAAFEELALDATYDLVYAAAALHWTEPEDRWSRVAALLEPHGIFASVGGPPHLADERVEAAVRQARAEVLPGDEIPSPDATPADSPMQWPGTELIRSSQFSDVRQMIIERRLAMTADHYVGYLSTVSAYLELSEPQRQRVLTDIRRVLPERVEVVADLVLHLARRA